MSRRPFALLLIAALLLSIAGLGAGAPPPSQSLLVKFRPGAPAAEVAAAHAAAGAVEEFRIPGIDVRVVAVPASRAAQALAAYGRNPNVAYAEPDAIAVAFRTPNDPGFASQWGLGKIAAPQAWELQTGAEVRVAILDTGIDRDHADLAAKIVAEKNFTRSRTTDDKYGHGTHVAGIAAAVTDNGAGVAGTSWGAVLMNGKVLGDDGSGRYSWVASGLVWAADNGARVINLSLGGSSPSQALQDAVDYAWGRGAVVVAAAGNSGSSAPSYPAAYANAIAVAATDSQDAKASFSNYGDWVDLAAPGVGIYSTLPNHKNRIGQTNYGTLSGTSMAAPFVSGAAALVWSQLPTDSSNGDVRAKLEGTADRVAGTGTYWANGRLNAYRAVQ